MGYKSKLQKTPKRADKFSNDLGWPGESKKEI
jgi:hypothetical protein